MRDRTEAENILKKIIEEDIIINQTTKALITLCELYFDEFRIFNEMEIVDDIHSLIDHLQKNAKKQNSYSSLANVKLLQAKLALIQVNMVEARKLLTEAQQIADDHDLQLLAGEISREHDRLLEELELWESIKKTKASVSERLKLASIDDVLERMQGRRAIKPLDVVNEEPVLLAIISKTGYMVLTNPFSVEIPFDEKRVGEFVSFLNSISDQIFSESIDRVKFGKFTILHKVIDSISICYLFEGQSYTALKRVNNFYEVIKNNSSIMDVLTLSKKTGESINLNENPELETLIAESFLSDSRKFQVSPEKEDVQKLIKKSRRIRKIRSARNKKVMRIVITEITIEIIALLLFLNSHLLFLGYASNLSPPPGLSIGSEGWMGFIEIALYLGLGFQLIVLNYMFINWIKDVIKNIFIIAEIITQIIALLLILTAHFFYLNYVHKLNELSALSHATIWFIINLNLYLGIGGNLLVIVLINIDYMKHHH
jgi:hypothetical protein